jgi:hypothetical protein
VASFDSSGKPIPKMFVKGAVINPSTQEEKIADEKGAIYKPALKLMNKPIASSAPTTPQDQTKTKPPTFSASSSKKDINDEAAVAALAIAEQDRINKKKAAEEKKKSNLELFKEELKRYLITTIFYKKFRQVKLIDKLYIKECNWKEKKDIKRKVKMGQMILKILQIKQMMIQDQMIKVLY